MKQEGKEVGVRSEDGSKSTAIRMMKNQKSFVVVVVVVVYVHPIAQAKGYFNPPSNVNVTYVPRFSRKFWCPRWIRLNASQSLW